MTLGDLIERLCTCYAGISITGLCEEYRDGLDCLKEEPWYLREKDRPVGGISVIGSDYHSFELCIEI